MSTSTRSHRTTGEYRIQVRVRHRHRAGHRAQGAERGHRPPHLRQEERAGVAAGVAPASALPRVAEDDRADVAERHLRRRSTTRTSLLRGAEGEEEAEQPGRSRSGDPRHLREARHPADRAAAARRRRRRRGVRLRLGGDDVRKKLAELGIIFCSFSEAVKDHPELVKQYLGSVVPYTDNFFAALNSAVFSDGCFVLHPEGRALPDGAVHLLPHQRQGHRPVRADADRRRGRRHGQLPRRLHGAHARREPAARGGRRAGRARRRAPSSTRPSRTGTRATRTASAASTTSSPSAASARACDSKITWTQVETGSAITWKYPSCILQGDDSVGEFYSVAVTNNFQQADTGTKMIHLGKNTRSTIVSKGISAGRGQNTYRGAVKIGKNADERAQLLAVRFAADWRPLRRAHVPVSRNQEHLGARSSTRRRPRRSARTRSSTASSAASRRKTRST